MLKSMAGKLFGSQTSLREANRANLLECIHRFGAMTQVELAESCGLSTATVSTLVHQLVDEGRLDTCSTVRNGRRATLVALARRQGLGIGLSISRRELQAAVLDYSKTVIAEHRLPLPLNHKADTTMERAMVLINETLRNVGADTDEVVGIGVALAAPVDSRTHAIAVPGVLAGWEGLDLATPLAEAFRVPVEIDNDANAAALGEARMGAVVGTSNFVYVHTSDGVGAGVMLNGELWRGITGLAGEIGHVQVDPLGSICACGNRGCLNTVVDEQRLVSLLSVTHGDMTMDDLVREASGGDPGCRRVVADAAVRIGNVAAGLCIAVDPEVVVVGGKLADTGPLFLDPFGESLQRLLFPSALTPIRVIPATHPRNGAALGAALMAIERAERDRAAQNS